MLTTLGSENASHTTGTAIVQGISNVGSDVVQPAPSSRRAVRQLLVTAARLRDACPYQLFVRYLLSLITCCCHRSTLPRMRAGNGNAASGYRHQNRALLRVWRMRRTPYNVSGSDQHNLDLQSVE